MNRIIKTAAAVLLAGALVGCTSGTSSNDGDQKDHLGRIQDAGKLIIGLEGDWQPFSFHDEDDNLVGFDVEVAQNIAQRIGVKADVVEGPWDGLFAGLSAGVYDVVVNGVDITEDRQKSYDFSDPYAYDNTVLVTASDNTDIKTFEDLDGRKTANSIGSTYMEMGEQYGAEVSGVDTLADTMTMVITGQVDATINAATSVQDYLNTTGETRVKIVAASDDSTPYAIPVVKGDDNKTLLESINKALAEMREDGTLAELSIKYFGADLTNK